MIDDTRRSDDLGSEELSEDDLDAVVGGLFTPVRPPTVGGG